MPRFGRSYPMLPFQHAATAAAPLVAFDSLGAGASSSNGFAGTWGNNYTHTTVAAKTLMVIIMAGRSGGQAGNSQTTNTCTVNGNNAIPIGTIQSVSSEGFLTMFYYVTTAAGNQAVAGNVGNGTFTGRSIMMNSTAYTGATKVSAPVITSGTGTPSITVPGGVGNNMIVVGIGGQQQTLSSFAPGTQRFVGGDGGFEYVLGGDGAGNVSTEGCASSAAGNGWTAMGVLLS